MFDLDENSENKIEVLPSILEARKKKEIEENTFIVKRAHFEKSTNEQIEAWFHRFFEVIIDDSENPYIVNYWNKKEAVIYYGKLILRNLNKRNLDRCIGYIHQATDGISQFSNQIGTNTDVLTKPKKTRKKHKPYNKKGGGFF